MAKLTKPGLSDNEWMTVTCTPDSTAVDFHEEEGDAIEHAERNVRPSTSTYVAKVTRQGEHRVRGTAKHVAVVVTVDDELRKALAWISQSAGRAAQQDQLETMMRDTIDGWLKLYRKRQT